MRKIRNQINETAAQRRRSKIVATAFISTFGAMWAVFFVYALYNDVAALFHRSFFGVITGVICILFVGALILGWARVMCIIVQGMWND